ncbi:MAM domain-containing protein 2 isoform X4 [Manis pentadactyla]|uniref:MAM domain-containing protein 2 isoform X4 n=1 Tax=Manis pentadactyla TaxID=143292 RepID=UPI00255CAF05|nr:MAM domain-containing protein 2 isoform X4 [Manis pentadactyla]
MLVRSVLLAVQALQLVGALDLPDGSCTFEKSTCGFDSVFEFLPWILNEEGHYIYVDTSFAKQGEKAVLLSSDLQAEEWSCLRLVYQIAAPSGSPPDPSRLNLYVRFEDESFDRWRWSATEPSDSWLIASLDLQNSAKKFKILIEGVLGQGNTASIALFEIKMTTGYCIECDFEENHLCGFVNRWNPNVNWFVGGGNIRNSHSILPQDHTLRSELGHYMYVDSVYIKHFQEVAQLISPMTTAPMSGCLSFYYQVQQENDNVFSLYTRDAAGLYEEIWKMSSPGNAAWNLAEVEFSAPYPMEVIFEVAFNGPKGGHVALDDISFSPVHCQNQTGLPFSAIEASCSFEGDLCNFYQDKEGPGWTRVKVKPNMYRAGDHTSGTGYYMYIEASHMVYGQKAHLSSRPLRGVTGKHCLTFFYHMYGAGTGLLSVYLKKEGDSEESLLWRRGGEQSISWTRALIEYSCERQHQVIFEAIRGVSIRSDIAIDDVKFQAGPCAEMEDTTQQSSGYSEDLNEIEF